MDVGVLVCNTKGAHGKGRRKEEGDENKRRRSSSYPFTPGQPTVSLHLRDCLAQAQVIPLELSSVPGGANSAYVFLNS